jgi:hypothetical protein
VRCALIGIESATSPRLGESTWKDIAAPQNLAILPLAIFVVIFLTTLDSGKIVSRVHAVALRTPHLDLIRTAQRGARGEAHEGSVRDPHHGDRRRELGAGAEIAAA